MTDYEPYVEDPAEPVPPPRFARLRPVLATLIIAVIIAAVAFIIFSGLADQDPALEFPVDGLDQVDPGQGDQDGTDGG
jgi:hypothetical protein